jgi:hypothetical protein
MLRALFGLVLLAHGAIHLAWLAPQPDDPKYPFRWHSRWFPNVSEATLKGPGAALITFLFLAYLASALGVWGVPVLSRVWGVAAVLGSVVSVFVTAVLWDPDFIANPIVDAAIIAIVLFGVLR